MNAVPPRAWSWKEFEGHTDAIETCALDTPGIDPFCSAPDWMFAAHRAWDNNLSPWIWRLESGYAAFLTDGFILTPFDRTWGYSCPLIGPPRVAYELAELLKRNQGDWGLVVITGIRREAPLFRAIIAAFSSYCEFALGEPQLRWNADLRGYLDRRPSKFKRELRRIEKKAEKAGITIENGEGRDVFERVLSVESRSWKGPAETGLNEEPMRDFYRALFRRLIARHRLRLRFARKDGEDIGYIAGGVIGDQYRGLQFSFDDRFREFSPGNLMQWSEIQALSQRGYRGYDLGIDIPYKERWADERVETSTLVIRRRARPVTP